MSNARQASLASSRPCPRPDRPGSRTPRPVQHRRQPDGLLVGEVEIGLGERIRPVVVHRPRRRILLVGREQRAIEVGRRSRSWPVAAGACPCSSPRGVDHRDRMPGPPRTAGRRPGDGRHALGAAGVPGHVGDRDERRRGDPGAGVATLKTSISRTGRSSPQSEAVATSVDPPTTSPKETTERAPLATSAARTTTGGVVRDVSRWWSPTSTTRVTARLSSIARSSGPPRPWDTLCSISSRMRVAAADPRGTASRTIHGWVATGCSGSSFGSPQILAGALPPGSTRARPPSSCSSSQAAVSDQAAGTARYSPRWITPTKAGAAVCPMSASTTTAGAMSGQGA